MSIGAWASWLAFVEDRLINLDFSLDLFTQIGLLGSKPRGVRYVDLGVEFDDRPANYWSDYIWYFAKGYEKLARDFATTATDSGYITSVQYLL